MTKARVRPVLFLLAIALTGLFAQEANAIPMIRTTTAIRPQLTAYKKKAAVPRRSVKRSVKLKMKRVSAPKSAVVAKVAGKKRKAAKRFVERIGWLWHAPAVKLPKVAPKLASGIKGMFEAGKGSPYSPAVLLAANVFVAKPLVGGIFKRHGTVKHIIIHSTETATEADAARVVRSWNNRGLRHPGAQYIVERNGTIYQTVDPAMGSVHVNSSRTRFGVTNDNSIGIEIVRAGTQKYTAPQKASVARLVVYLQERFRVAGQAIMGHGYVQPGNRTDPVGFDWNGFYQLVAAIKPDYRIANGGKIATPVARTTRSLERSLARGGQTSRLPLRARSITTAS